MAAAAGGAGVPAEETGRWPAADQGPRSAGPARRAGAVPDAAPVLRGGAGVRPAADDGAGGGRRAGQGAAGGLRPDGPAQGRAGGPAAPVHRPGVHRLLQPTPVLLAVIPPDAARGHRGLRAGLALLRRRVRGDHPRLAEGDRDRVGPDRAEVQHRVRGVRPGPQLRDRPGSGAEAAGQASRGAGP